MQRKKTRHVSAASGTVLLKIAVLVRIRMCCVFFCPQARQILEREYNNLLALGTDRRLDEVSKAISHESEPPISTNLVKGQDG